jgi:hypothetical protein
LPQLLTLSEHQGSIRIRLKHFNADMAAWKEKDRIGRIVVRGMGPAVAAAFGQIVLAFLQTREVQC